MFPEGFDMSGLLAQAQAMQTQLQATQADLAARTYTGTAGGDLVSATISGTGELVGLEIAPAAIDPDDPEGLADLIIAAARDAHTQMSAAVQAAMPGLPDLSALGL